ncbi:MAG: hypothetical protein EP344_16020 [Bacteroidetes bacterium]|nr:MAG: hypothetical protein EP344_16020 [Bacteroidota bacterium]
MINKIDSLDDLLAEKERLRKQIEIVQGEMNASAGRTRLVFNQFLENKLSLPRQLGQLFQGGAKQAVESGAVSAIGKAAGLSTWWSGLLSAFAPVLMNFVRRQLQRRKEKQLAAAVETQPAEDAMETVVEAPPATQPKRRGLFKRKKSQPEPENNTDH